MNYGFYAVLKNVMKAIIKRGWFNYIQCLLTFFRPNGSFDFFHLYLHGSGFSIERRRWSFILCSNWNKCL